MNDEYNGWRNYPTWLCAVWGDCESPDWDAFKESLEDSVDEMPNGALKDICSDALQRIDWQRLKENE